MHWMCNNKCITRFFQIKDMTKWWEAAFDHHPIARWQAHGISVSLCLCKMCHFMLAVVYNREIKNHAVEADKLTISFSMFPIICIIFSHSHMLIYSLFLIFIIFFFSLDKIALHLSVNILSFLYWSGT